MGDIAKSPFLLLLLLIAVVVQFQTLYLKNRKRCRSEICTQVGSNYQICNDLSKCL